MGRRRGTDFLSVVGRDRLRKLIVEDKLSIKEIADIFEFSKKTVERAWRSLQKLLSLGLLSSELFK